MFEEGGDQGLENLKHQDTCVTLVIFTPSWVQDFFFFLDMASHLRPRWKGILV